MAASVAGLLHTNSKYAQNLHYSYSGLNKRMARNIMAKINHLEANEKKFYNLFGASDFESFKRQINKWFDQGDIKFLKSFENELLRTQNSIFQFFKGARGQMPNQEEEVRLILNIEDIRKLKIPGFQIRTNSQEVKCQDLEISTGVKVNKQLGKIINEVFERKPNKKGEISTRKITKKEILNAVTEGVNREYITIIAGEHSTPTLEFLINIEANEYLGFSKAEIERILSNKDDPNYQELREYIVRSRNKIYEYIFNVLMGSASVSLEMRQATTRVWNQLAGANDSSGEKLVQYFSGGGNYVNVFIGAMGEFQSAVMMEYLMIKAGLKGAQAEIIGQEMLTGVQPKRDVVVQWAANLGNKVGFGVQVKNYSTSQNKIDTSMNFQAEMDKFGDNATQNFFDFVANYYFNESFQQGRKEEIEQVKQFFSDQVVELYNLQTDETLSSDKISFYHISANTLVPASAIARAAYQISNMRQPVKISSSYHGTTDEGFEKIVNGAPLFMKYWNGNEPNTEAMNSERTNIFSKITISGGFDYTELVKKYSLYE